MAAPSPPGDRAKGRTGPRAAAERGATYLALLVLIAATGAMLGASATLWSTLQQRERERELLWAGEQIRSALRSYAAAGGGRPPDALEELLEDPRTPARRRHLRRIYADPMTGRADWVLLRDARGGVVGVHSRSPRAPLKTGGFAGAQSGFANAASYSDWQFTMAAPAAAPASAPGTRADPRGDALVPAPKPLHGLPAPRDDAGRDASLRESGGASAVGGHAPPSRDRDSDADAD